MSSTQSGDVLNTECPHWQRPHALYKQLSMQIIATKHASTHNMALEMKFGQGQCTCMYLNKKLWVLVQICKEKQRDEKCMYSSLKSNSLYDLHLSFDKFMKILSTRNFHYMCIVLWYHRLYYYLLMHGATCYALYPFTTFYMYMHVCVSTCAMPVLGLHMYSSHPSTWLLLSPYIIINTLTSYYCQCYCQYQQVS